MSALYNYWERALMHRREFLKNCAQGAGAISLANIYIPGAYAGENTKKPNILWIIAEDFCPDLGCYGNKQVKTHRWRNHATFHIHHHDDAQMNWIYAYCNGYREDQRRDNYQQARRFHKLATDQ